MLDSVNLFYVLASVFFILGLKKLSHPKSARKGNALSSLGMFIAIIATLIFYSDLNFIYILCGMIIGGSIGILFAVKVEMTVSRHCLQ